MRIDPRASALEVGADQVQLGNGPRAVVVDARPRGVRTLLSELTAGTAAPLPALARRCGMEVPALRRLLEGLAPVLEEHGAMDREAGSTTLPHDVQVDGLGPTGTAVAALLASAGVGRLALTDPRPVLPEQLGHGLVSADVGRPRAEALAQRLGDRGVTAVAQRHGGRGGRGAVAAAGACRGRDGLGPVTVVVTAGAWDVDLLARAQAAHRAVLPVVVRDEDTVVGPWCAPRMPGCPLCWERWAEQEDPLRSERTAALHRAEAGRETAERAHRTASVVLAALRQGAAPGRFWRVQDDAECGAGVAEDAVAPWPGCACGG